MKRLTSNPQAGSQIKMTQESFLPLIPVSRHVSTSGYSACWFEERREEVFCSRNGTMVDHPWLLSTLCGMLPLVISWRSVRSSAIFRPISISGTRRPSALGRVRHLAWPPRRSSSAMLTNKDLAALLPRVAMGDRAAFEQVYRAACAHLLGVAFRILNSRERAEEVLQEAFMNVWHSAGGFDASVAGPMTWLINIVRNKAIDALRSGKTERASTLAFDEEALAVAADETQQPQALLERSLEKLRITECMGGLGAPQRQALALAYYRGMVHTEIAETLGAPLGTVKAWVRRGLDKLKDCLEAAGVRRDSLA